METKILILQLYRNPMTSTTIKNFQYLDMSDNFLAKSPALLKDLSVEIILVA